MSKVAFRGVIVHGKVSLTRQSWWRGVRWHGACVRWHMAKQGKLKLHGELILIV